MKLNGGFAATISGVMFASSLAWGSYLTQRSIGNREHIVALETEMAGLRNSLDRLANESAAINKKLERLDDTAAKRFATLHDLILELHSLKKK